MNKIVIIGGGLAGLSAGYHLREYNPVLFEKESKTGGLCRSFSQDGFTFDCTGHLLHLKHAYTRELVDRLLPDAFNPHERKAAIYSKSVTTPYPFQANTYGLPPAVVKECVLGFVETLNNAPRNGNHASFKDWVLTTFGSGIAKHFMLPYNEKFWKMDLADVSSEWVSWSIPKPTMEEVINGALGLTNNGMGYNPRFIYPRKGGIDCIPDALSRGSTIHSDHVLEMIDPRKKFVRFQNGREESYDRLITTIPLPLTFDLIRDTPDDLKQAAKGLRAISVLNFNIGVDRPNVSDKHWIYYPEDEYIFSRIGFPSNFSTTLAPPNTSSIYIEITYGHGRPPDTEEAFERSLVDLQKCGILRKDDRILTRNMIDIACAYIVFDRHRLANIEKLIGYLASRDIYTAGRYGKWDYYSMEDSILSGKSASEAAAGRLSAELSKTGN